MAFRIPTKRINCLRISIPTCITRRTPPPSIRTGIFAVRTPFRLAPADRVRDCLPVLPLGVTGIAANYKPPVSYQYSAGVQQSVGTHAVLSVSYVGSQGRHENYYQAINLPPENLLPGMVAAHALDNTKVQYLGFGGIRLGYNGGNAKYNSLQTSLNGTVHRDLHLQVAYTFSKAEDSTTSNG